MSDAGEGGVRLRAPLLGAPTRAALAAIVAGRAARGPVGLADLTFGSWRSGQLGDELRAQLTPPDPGRPAAAPGGDQTGAGPAGWSGHGDEHIRSAIDNETGGDPVALDAASCAHAILRASRAPATVLVLVPRFGLPWSDDDAMFVEVLARHLRGGADLMLLDGGELPAWPDGWVVEDRDGPPPAGSPATDGSGLAHLIPGVLEPGILGVLATEGLEPTRAVVALPSGHAVVAPELRRPLASEAALRFDRLGVLAAGAGAAWLAAFAQVHGSNYFVDGPVLLDEARRQLARPSVDVPLRLVRRAADCARHPLERHTLEAHAQSIRIAAHRFAEAATVPDPPPGLPDVLSAALVQAKGWALVMTGRAAEGEEYLVRARDGTRAEPVPVRLYLANITALARMRAGDLKAALAMERDIEAELTALDPPHRHLEYVNNLNLARVHRRLGNWAAAERHYDRAFATVEGVRSESDSLYANVNSARLHEEKGDVGATLAAWLRAALHHLAAGTPEAVAPRVATAVVGGRCGRGAATALAVSTALEGHLRRAAIAAGLAPVAGKGNGVEQGVPYFVTTGAGAGSCVSVEGGPGWGVARFGARRGGGARHPDADGLAVMAWRVMVELGAATGDDTGSTAVVDDRHGMEIPGTGAELLSIALRLGAPRLTFAGHRVELPGWLRHELAQDSDIRLGAGVEGVEPSGAAVLVSFKRYIHPRLVTGVAVAVVAAARSGIGAGPLGTLLGDVVGGRRLATLIEDLERRRIVQRVPSADACRRLGLTPPPHRPACLSRIGS